MEDINILEQKAIDAAINTSWKEAVVLNRKIIRLDKKNIDAYLRLGFAYLQLKNFDEAKKCYQKILKFQPSNQTAIENLERIKILAGKKLAKKSITLNPDLFLEVPGKTKSITLVNPGQKNILAQLTVGQQVFLRQKKRRLEIRTDEKQYIGCLPDDLSRRLSVLIKAGSEFSAHIKEAGLKKVVVFLREVKRGKKSFKIFSLSH
ncbi:MAG: tetratricopeptide repeat protein [Microgenomates group bacterium]